MSVCKFCMYDTPDLCQRKERAMEKHYCQAFATNDATIISYLENGARKLPENTSRLGRGLADVMAEAETDYARDSERVITYQSDRITELEAENATLRNQLSLTRSELITALKHLRGH